MKINTSKIITVAKQASFLGLTGLIVLTEMLFLFASMPKQWQQLADLKHNKDEFSRENAKLARATEVLRSIDQVKLEVQVAAVNAALPTLKKTSGLVRGVTDISQSSGVELRDVSFSPGRIATDSAVVTTEKVKGTVARAIPGGLTVSGDIGAIINFITNLQAANQLIGVESVSYSLSASGRTARVSVKMFYQPASNEAINWDNVRSINKHEEEILSTLTGSDQFILPEEQH